jgi:enterobactin synthetase component D
MRRRPRTACIKARTWCGDPAMIDSRYGERVWSVLAVARAVEIDASTAASLRAALDPLPPEAATFAPPRLASFLLGRAAAMSALGALGVETRGALPIDAHGAPVWPSGIVGSITHDGDLAACAVARESELRGVGIDLQRVTNARADTVEIVADASELSRLDAVPESARFAVIFSAKESLYKCLAPTVLAVFGFEDACVTFADATRVRLRLERTLAPSLEAGMVFDARWSLADGLVRTALEWRGSATTAARKP